jgi:hypothetical protein
MTDGLKAALRRAADVPLRTEDYEDIARTAERRRRRTRGLSAGIVAAVAVAVVGLAAALVPLTRPDGRGDGRGDGRTDDRRGGNAAGPGNGIRVPGTRAGDSARYRLAFLDGSRVDLTVPAAAGLDAMTVRPGGGARIPAIADRDFVVPAAGLDWFASIGAKVRELRRTGGTVVSLWSVAEPGGGPAHYLVFEFGPWTIGVVDGGAAPETWASNLEGRTTADGFLVLTATAPLELLGADSGAPPSLSWSDAGGNGLTVRRQACTTAIDDASGTGDEQLRTLCRPSWGATVEVHGEAAYVAAVVAGVSIG